MNPMRKRQATELLETYRKAYSREPAATETLLKDWPGDSTVEDLTRRFRSIAEASDIDLSAVKFRAALVELANVVLSTVPDATIPQLRGLADTLDTELLSYRDQIDDDGWWEYLPQLVRSMTQQVNSLG